MGKRITLTEDDIILLVMLLKNADCGHGFKFVASKQRVSTLLRKLNEKEL